jgi:hypothetical protein
LNDAASKQPAPLQTEGLEKKNSVGSPTTAGTSGPTPISAAPASGVAPVSGVEGEPGKY